MAPWRRHWVLSLVVLTVMLGGLPALWTRAVAQTGGDEAPATWTDEEVSDGFIGNYDIIDLSGAAGARCDNDLRSFPGFVDLEVRDLTASIAPDHDVQDIAAHARLYQRLADDQVELIAESDLATRGVTASFPHTPFPPVRFSNLPIGPAYVVQVEILWYGADGETIEGSVRSPIDFYQPTSITGDAPVNHSVEDACEAPVAPLADVDDDVRGTVNSWYDFALYYFPLNAPVDVRWDGRGLDPVATDERGQATGRFRIPATPKGTYEIEWLSGTWGVTRSYTVVPRIKVIPGTVARGQEVNVSLRGFAAHETVRIRWKKGSSWIELDRVATSSTGSANIDVRVPEWAAEGRN